MVIPPLEPMNPLDDDEPHMHDDVENMDEVDYLFGFGGLLPRTDWNFGDFPDDLGTEQFPPEHGNQGLNFLNVLADPPVLGNQDLNLGNVPDVSGVTEQLPPALVTKYARLNFLFTTILTRFLAP